MTCQSETSEMLNKLVRSSLYIHTITLNTKLILLSCLIVAVLTVYFTSTIAYTTSTIITTSTSTIITTSTSITTTIVTTYKESAWAV